MGRPGSYPGTGGRPEIDRRVDESLRRVAMDRYRNHLRELPAGSATRFDRPRLAIEPQLLVLDEPTGY